MIRALIGIVVLVICAALVRAVMPKDGKVHPLATAPVLESVIPLSIIVLIVAGLALIFSAFTA
jgi:p-aminobenzoyl-glutamate transporter AbgT